MKKGNTSLLRMLQSAGKDPTSHDKWIADWKELYDEFENTPDSSLGFSEIEHAALGALSNVKVTDTHAHLSNAVCRMLDTFKHPALLVDSAGRITAQNAIVKATYNLAIGDTVEQLPVQLSHAETLEDTVKEVLKSGFPKGKALFKQAHSRDSSHALTLAITNSTGDGGQAALVFIIGSKFGESVAHLVKNQYDLTTAECQVLIRFVEGYSLKEIAIDRARSHATIRTQFNSLMTKMGAHSQASLLRTAFSLSDFTREMDKFSLLLEHPYRRQAEIMREGGRIVEVCLCGDPSGSPLLHIPHAAVCRFNATVEEQLHQAGLYVITVSPPSYGRTDPPASGDNRAQLRIDDIEAVMDMLKIESCPVMVSSPGTYEAFRLAAALPDRISSVVLVGGCPPANYWFRYGTGASWVDAVLRVSENYPSMRKVIIAAGLKAWIVAGSKKFHRLQLAGNKRDIEIQMRPENVREIEHALESAIVCGFSPLMEDIEPLFNDYSDVIAQSRCKISVIHGVEDAVLPVKSMRDFQNDLPHRVELSEIEGAGFTIFISHTAKVVGLLRDIADRDIASCGESAVDPLNRDLRATAVGHARSDTIYHH